MIRLVLFLIQNAKFKIQNDTTERYIEYLSVVVLGSLRSLGNNESYENYGIANKTLCVAIKFFGFRGYPRRGCDEKEIWSCQVYLNKLHISFLS